MPQPDLVLFLRIHLSGLHELRSTMQFCQTVFLEPLKVDNVLSGTPRSQSTTGFPPEHLALTQPPI